MMRTMTTTKLTTSKMVRVLLLRFTGMVLTTTVSKTSSSSSSLDYFGGVPSVHAFGSMSPLSFGPVKLTKTPPFRRLASSSWSGDDDIKVDPSGRRVRSRANYNGGGDDDDDDYNDGDRAPPRRMRSGGGRRSRNADQDQDSLDATGGWDDFDPWNSGGGSQNNNGGEGGWSSRRSNSRPPSTRRPPRNYNDDDDNDGWGGGGGGGGGGRPQRQPRRQGGGGGGGGGDRRGGYRDRDSGGYQDRDRRDRRPRGGFRDRDQSSSFRSSSRNDNSRRGGGSFGNRGNPNNNNNNNRFNKEKPLSTTRAINMNALEVAGFVHLYGLSSVLNALSVDRRDFQTSKEDSDAAGWTNDDDHRFSKLSGNDYSFDDDDEEEDAGFNNDQGSTKHEVKPQAQFRPYLFVQERSTQSGRRGSKASAAAEIIKLAQQKGVPVEYVDKGILNTLSGNRPHQGFVLRCGKLSFESLSKIPVPTVDDDDSSRTKSPSIWLALDEVVDPQNLGALLRSAYFLGGGNQKSLGVLVCSKNSAPPSPVVSAASAGALELLDVHSTSNLPRTLSQATKDGFRVIGASSSVSTQLQRTSSVERSQVNKDGDSWDDNNQDEIENLSSPESSAPPPLYDLQDLPVQLSGKDGSDRPILLVLGSEGQGLRSLVAKSCTEFVRIPSGLGPSSPAMEDGGDEEDDDTEAGVDSLNVSVSAGIMLWYLLSGKN